MLQGFVGKVLGKKREKGETKMGGTLWGFNPPANGFDLKKLCTYSFKFIKIEVAHKSP